MAGTIGRKILLALSGQPVAGLRSKNPKFNKEPIDITDDNSEGWRELLAEPGQRDVTIPVSGLMKDDFFMSEFFAGNVLRAVTLTYPDGGVISGDFFLATYSQTGEYNGAVTFDTELQSSGEVSYNSASQ